MARDDDGPNTCLKVGSIGLGILYGIYLVIIVGLVVFR